MEPVLYVDMGSPYAWLAVERAPALLGTAPRLEPIALGAIFRHRGHGSWAHTPGRAANIAEVERRAAAYGLPPVRWPPGWPPNSLHADRAALWAVERGRGHAFALAAFRAAFTGGRDLADHAVLRDAAARAGLPDDELEDGIADPQLKEELKRRTAAAIEAGVPGVPTLRLGTRLLYGDDRLEEALR